MRPHVLVLGLLASAIGSTAMSADPPYNPFVGAPQADAPRPAAPAPPLPAIITPQLMQPPMLMREPAQLRSPPPRDLTVVVVHDRIAILRTQSGRYPVKDGEILTLEGARYRAGVRDGTVRLTEIESQIIVFEGYIGAGLAPEHRNPSRRAPGPQSPSQMLQLPAPARTGPAQLPSLPPLPTRP